MPAPSNAGGATKEVQAKRLDAAHETNTKSMNWARATKDHLQKGFRLAVTPC